MKKLFAVTLAVVIATISTPSAQEKVDKDIQWKIRREANENSQILRTLHLLTDVHGPRLTGSPNLKAARSGSCRRRRVGTEERATSSRGTSGIPAG